MNLSNQFLLQKLQKIQKNLPPPVSNCRPLFFLFSVQTVQTDSTAAYFFSFAAANFLFLHLHSTFLPCRIAVAIGIGIFILSNPVNIDLTSQWPRFTLSAIAAAANASFQQCKLNAASHRLSYPAAGI